MLTVEHLNTQVSQQVERFVELPYRLYADHPQWVPPFRQDETLLLNRQGHFIHKNFEVDFLLVRRDEQDVGRIAVMLPRHDDQPEGRREARFALFDCTDDTEAAVLLFDRAITWARERGATRIFGPNRLMFLDGDGILIEGFAYPQVMYMTPYNYPYYAKLIEAAGFEKDLDFLSSHIDVTSSVKMPDWIQTMATWVQQKGNVSIQSFDTIEALLEALPQLIAVLQKALVQNQSVETASDDALSFAVQHALKIGIDPQLIKTILNDDVIVGVVLAFPNLSTVCQRLKGEFDQSALRQAINDAPGIVFNGFGILPEFQLQGFQALLFAEIEKTIHATNVQTLNIIQIAETTGRMKNDMLALGITPTQIHRRYTRTLDR